MFNQQHVVGFAIAHGLHAEIPWVVILGCTLISDIILTDPSNSTFDGIWKTRMVEVNILCTLHINENNTVF